jgi:Endonuclease/Exonuclease/phosphatase family
MNKILWTVTIISLLHTQILSGQNEDTLSIMFWNLENLFDIYDDSTTLDEEFLPESIRHWNSYRYYAKINMIWKVILSAGYNNPPDLLTFAEVENGKVLNDLILYSPFGFFGYKIIHANSPDLRGIDVALAYNPDKINIDSSLYIKNELSNLGGGPTRDILYCKCRINKEVFHLFVNHWPSKYGGQAYTEAFRMNSARLLKVLTDSLIGQKIICTGDFNDTPDSRCIQSLIKDEKSNLILLRPLSPGTEGTIKYQGLWQYIDHFLVSPELLYKNNNLYSKLNLTYVYSPSFLLEKDLVYGGIKPFRTWSGFQYNRGVSDHLPIILKLVIKEEITNEK